MEAMIARYVGKHKDDPVGTIPIIRYEPSNYGWCNFHKHYVPVDCANNMDHGLCDVRVIREEKPLATDGGE